MRLITQRLVGLACALIFILTAVPVRAHSFPKEQNPYAGQQLSSSPSQVVIRFDAPIEKVFASLQVLGPDGQNVAGQAPTISDDGYVLSTKVKDLKSGQYKVSWAVVGKDTHRTQGSYYFTIAPGS